LTFIDRPISVVRLEQRTRRSAVPDMRPLIFLATLVGAVMCVLIARPSAAQTVEDFYRNKQIRVIIGYGAGGGYDVYARLVTRYMSRFIPGHPTMVAQNMPGAGTALAAEYLMHVAPQDGTVLATLGQNLPFDQIMDPKRGALFNTAEMNWIGNAIEDNNVVEVWRASGITSIEDAKNRETVLAATSADGSDALYPQVLNNVLGTKFKIIAGFPGGAEQNLAMERGEVDGRGSDTMSSIRATTPRYLTENKIRIILQMGFASDPDLPGVPLMLDLARTQAERQVFEMISSGVRIGRPILTTPGVPPDRLQALRDAFDATMKDPAFLAEAAQAKLEIKPVPGIEVQKLVENMVGVPKDVVELTRAAVTTTGQTFNCADVAKDKSICEKAKP
jgi:tripartite-type tricarboxylate transporter receptor subunit TctC